MNEILSIFIFYFAVIDPIGSVPVFIAVTKGYTELEKRATALKAVFVSFLVLIFFIVAGEIILDAIGIPLPAFQIAGGIILFMFAITMIFGDSKPESEIKSITNTTETAIFPMAMPSIASPGAMLAVVLLTKNSEYSILEQLQSSLIMASVLAIVLVLLLLSTKVYKIIGSAGASVISRVMGLILTAVAADNVIQGIKASFGLLP
jgi:multiple antibiotic resistance protein